MMSNKREEESYGNDDLFSTLPLDLKVEILEKLPAKSIAKLIFVSKFWSSIIRGKDFTDLYLNRSSTRPRLLLFSVCNDIHVLHSCSQEDPSSDDHYKVTSASVWQSQYDVCPPIRGLICCRNGNEVAICNPSTGQFLNLPQLETKRKFISIFFGYERVNDVYKVLCMTVAIDSDIRWPQFVMEEHQVFTLGPAKQETWRMITCKHPHLPYSRTKGLCVNGFLYYSARINGERSLISFDLINEDFNVIKLPEDARSLGLVNYKGKIALTSKSCKGTLDLRVLKDASKQEWSKVSFLIPFWGDLVGRDTFKFKGVVGSGELIFTSRRFIKPFYLLRYDTKVNNARKIEFEGIGDTSYDVKVFLDHLESPMFLQR